jgi:hypothetical protein
MLMCGGGVLCGAGCCVNKRIVNGWLAFLPLIPGLGLLGIVGLRDWRQLEPTALRVFWIFTAAQQCAALLTPSPVLASLTALARSAVILGLLALGARLRHGQALWPVVYGGFVVLLTSLVTSTQLRGGGVFAARLQHPYLTEVTLGVLGVLGILLCIFGPLPGFQGFKWNRAVRVAGVISFAGLLLLSGSRGPIVMLLAGLLVAAAVSNVDMAERRAGAIRSWGFWLVGAVMGLVGIVTVLGHGAGFLGRLLSTDTTGRDLLWLNVIQTVAAHPFGGVGAYLFGSTLAHPRASCDLWPTLAEAGYQCPAWLAELGQPWLIAHNGVLQQLGESGVVGTAGLLLLWGVVIARLRSGRDSAAAALIVALLVGNFLDDTTVVPSPFFAELFWLAAGTQVAFRTSESVADGPGRWNRIWPSLVAGSGILMVMGFPLWATLMPTSRPDVRLDSLSADVLSSGKEPYRVHVQLSGKPGSYRLALRACAQYCQTVTVNPVSLGQAPQNIWLQGELSPTPVRQRLSLLLLPALTTPLKIKPLAQEQWTVEVTP